MTKYEKAIYDIVSMSHAHLTAYQVYERLSKTHPKVVPATVYNNLNKLWEAGLVRKISIEGMPDRYDSVQKHDHLVCKHCGKLMDVSFRNTRSSSGRTSSSTISRCIISVRNAGRRWSAARNSRRRNGFHAGKRCL